MEDGYELDLTYVTERIIAVSFPQDCFEETYLRNLRDVTRMLKSKHADNYLIINLSERKQELTRMNPKTLDTGWPDLHAPPLDKICTICKAIENWLNADPLHVVVIHCRGGKGRIGVVISSFVHFTDVSASADQALDRFAMRKFYDDKVSAVMTPSQKRYVWILSSLLSGSIKMNTSPLFLHYIIIQGVPRYDSAGVCEPYLKVYQGMQVVYVSGIYHIGAGHRDRVCIALEPAQLLKGDIMVKCFHKSSSSSDRELIFRVQFHTGAVQAYSTAFQKQELENACTDSRFPDHGKVELVFSDGPERLPGSESYQNGPAVTVDYTSTDTISRWDSYQNLCGAEAAPLQAPASSLDRLSIRRISSLSGALCRPQNTSSTSSPDHTLSASSDSGLSSASLPTAAPALGPGTAAPSRQERVELKRLLSGCGVEEWSRERSPMEAPTAHTPHTPQTPHMLLNGRARQKERETDILDDEVSRHDLHSLDSLGTLSSSCHKSSQNSLLSDGFGSPARAEEPVTAPPPHMYLNSGYSTLNSGYSTQTWVHQQQMVAALQYSYLPEEDAVEERFHNHTQDTSRHTTVANISPLVPERPQTDKKHDEEFSSLTLDIDNSIHQLNQLILDLDPTFLPVSSKPSSPEKPVDRNGNTQKQKRSRDTVDLGGSCVPQLSWTLDLTTADRHTLTPDDDDDDDEAMPQTQHQHAAVFRAAGVQYSSHTPLDTGSDQMPSTPAFPISPPTPYVKSMVMNYPPYRHTPSPSFGSCRAEHEMRGSAGFMGDEALQHRPYSGDATFTDIYRPPPGSGSVVLPPVSSSPPAGLRSLQRSRLQVFQEQLSLSLQPQQGLEGLRGLEGLEQRLQHAASDGEHSQGSVSPAASGFSSPHSGSSINIPFPNVLPELQTRAGGGATLPPADVLSNKQLTAKFVQDTSKYWYKPDIAREQAIALLKDKEPGFFIVRDSHSFRGAYGLAMKVSTPPPSALQQSRRGGDLSSELVRHFLIECTPRGVRLKGCPNEPYFGSLTALVCQHSITPLALPCKLIIPDRDPLEDAVSSSQSITNSAAELLKQGAACNVWFLGSVEMESLTGDQAIQKASAEILNADALPACTLVHFKVSSQGITLTDNQRKLFFRRHYAVNTVIFCALDPQDRRWKRDGCASARIFGFVARKAGVGLDNVCHLFAEQDPEQPAAAIVNFVSKVMIGSQKS